VLFVVKPKLSLEKFETVSVFEMVGLSLSLMSSVKKRFKHFLDLVALFFFSTGDDGITSGLDSGLEKDLELGVIQGLFSLYSMIVLDDSGGMRENRDVIFNCLKLSGWL